MKVSKEDVIGVLTALEHWFGERDADAERHKWDEDCATIAARVAQIPGAISEIVEPAGVDRVPRLKITWDRERYPLDGLALRGRVLDGEPRVMLDDNSATGNSIAVDPFQLQPGEANQVGDAVVAALLVSAQAERAHAHAPALTIAGNWELRVEFLQGARTHRLNLEQKGADLTGHQKSAQFDGPVEGALEADTVRFSFEQRYEASKLSPIASRAGSETARWRAPSMLGATSSQNGGISQPQPVRRRRMARATSGSRKREGRLRAFGVERGVLPRALSVHSAREA